MEILTPNFIDGVLWVFLILAGLLALFVIVSCFCLMFVAPKRTLHDDRYDISGEMKP
jgi:hypothetical protein